MKIKLKINGKKPRIYKGEEAYEVPQGTALIITKDPMYEDNNTEGEILLRTDESRYPFVSLIPSKNRDQDDARYNKAGFLWGDGGLVGYEFQEVECEIEI